MVSQINVPVPKMVYPKDANKYAALWKTAQIITFPIAVPQQAFHYFLFQVVLRFRCSLPRLLAPVPCSDLRAWPDQKRIWETPGKSFVSRR